jgi:hypothetical protein
MAAIVVIFIARSPWGLWRELNHPPLRINLGRLP